jgi:hypothetical protein
MPFSALTLTRNDIDAFEGETFRDVNVTGSGTTLNISLRDTLVLDKPERVADGYFGEDEQVCR